jgi:hypothetical protein
VLLPMILCEILKRKKKKKKGGGKPDLALKPLSEEGEPIEKHRVLEYHRRDG